MIVRGKHLFDDKAVEVSYDKAQVRRIGNTFSIVDDIATRSHYKSPNIISARGTRFPIHKVQLCVEIDGSLYSFAEWDV